MDGVTSNAASEATLQQLLKALGGSGTGAGAGASAAPAAAGGNDAKIAKLMELGFPKEQCEQALSAAGGNEEHAAAILFGG